MRKSFHQEIKIHYFICIVCIKMHLQVVTFFGTLWNISVILFQRVPLVHFSSMTTAREKPQNTTYFTAVISTRRNTRWRKNQPAKCSLAECWPEKNFHLTEHVNWISASGCMPKNVFVSEIFNKWNIRQRNIVQRNYLVSETFACELWSAGCPPEKISVSGIFA